MYLLCDMCSLTFMLLYSFMWSKHYSLLLGAKWGWGWWCQHQLFLFTFYSPRFVFHTIQFDSLCWWVFTAFASLIISGFLWEYGCISTCKNDTPRRCSVNMLQRYHIPVVTTQKTTHYLKEAIVTTKVNELRKVYYKQHRNETIHSNKAATTRWWVLGLMAWQLAGLLGGTWSNRG